MDYKSEYLRWCECAKADKDVRNELQDMASDEERIEDAFTVSWHSVQGAYAA